VILPFLLDSSQEQQFLVPGGTQVLVEEPGRYYLWNDYQTVYEGRSYNGSESLPDGLEIRVVDEVAGTPLPFTPDTSISSSTGGDARKSIGYVEAVQPGSLSVTVTGDVEERVFSFSPSRLLLMFAVIFGAVGGAFLAAFVGIGLIIWGIVKVARNGKKDGPVGEPAAAIPNGEGLPPTTESFESE
ncbi:MAG: hypothetical protein ACYTGH_19785, partial [Planctomycetota bacterium]|jgi:hypothetical protein